MPVAHHHLFIQEVFDKVTLDTGKTAFFTGEFGAGLAVMGIIVAGLFLWLERHERDQAKPGYAG